MVGTVSEGVLSARDAQITPQHSRTCVHAFLSGVCLCECVCCVGLLNVCMCECVCAQARNKENTLVASQNTYQEALELAV
jgi:hypothetical protein